MQIFANLGCSRMIAGCRQETRTQSGETVTQESLDALRRSLKMSANPKCLPRRTRSFSFDELCCAFDDMGNGGTHSAEDIETAIREMVYSPLFTDGTIVQFRFPEGVSDKVRERFMQIHAEVCDGWGCDPSLSRDPKA